MIALSWAALPKEDTRGDINKIVPSVVGVLDQIFLGCTVYWYQMGSQNPCNQKIVDTLFNSKTSAIKVTVTTKKDEKFSATATHVNNPVILKVDSDGDVFIKVKDCDFNIDTIDTSDVNLEDLAGQCHSGAAPPKPPLKSLLYPIKNYFHYLCFFFHLKSLSSDGSYGLLHLIPL